MMPARSQRKASRNTPERRFILASKTVSNKNLKIKDISLTS